MPLPKPITFSYSYTGFQQSQGNNSFPGTRMDADMAEIKQSVNDIVTFLGQVFQEGGKLKAEFLPGADVFEGLSASIHAEVATATTAAVASFNASLAANVAAAIPDDLAVNSVQFIPTAVVPANAQAGSVYFDILSGNLKVYNGTSAIPVGTGTGTPVTPGGSTGGTGGTGTPSPTAPTNITLSNNSVLENSPSGTVVGTLAADQTGCTFSLQSGDTTYFTIVGNELRTSGIFLDFEAAATRSVTIRATNGVNLTFDKAFTINVQDVVEGGGGGIPLSGKPDAAGPVANVNWDLPTVNTVGHQVALDPATNISTNSASPVFRSGTQITLKGTNPVLEGMDLRNYNLVLTVPNCTIRNCLFNAFGGRTIYAPNTDLGGHVIEWNTFDGENLTSGSHTEFIFLEARTHQKSVRFNKVMNTQSDGFTFGGSCEFITWNFFSRMGMRAGAHPDCITLNAGYANQKRTTIAYNYMDQLGPTNSGVVASNATIKIADNPDLRSNYLIHRNLHRGGSIQTQLDMTKTSKLEFHENAHFILNGPPVYGPLGGSAEPALDGPFGAFSIYGTAGDIIITGAIEARDGQPAFEPAGGSGTQSTQRGTQKVEWIPAGRPAKPVINSISSAGAISIAPASGAVSYQYVTSIAGTGEFGAEQPLSLTGTNPLNGNITPIPNAYNHTLVRGIGANGLPGPWSATFEFSSSVAATPTAPTLSGVTLSGVPTQGQTLTATPGTATGVPSPTITYQWQRDVAGNASYTNISGATGSTYTLTSADATNKVRVVATATNGVGPPAVANSAATALIAAASTSISFRSVGTIGVGVSSATAGVPAGKAAGDLMLRVVQYSAANQPDNSPTKTSVPTPANWIDIIREDFYGQCGGGVFKRTADGTSGDTPGAVTVAPGDVRTGDYITDCVLAFTGGSGAIDAFATARETDVTNTTFTAPSLTATGPNRKLVTFWFTEFNGQPATAVTGSAPTGFTELVERTETDPTSYMQNFAVDIKDAAVGPGVVAGETRTFSSGPRLVVAISVLIY